jgi:hypothetical protein
MTTPFEIRQPIEEKWHGHHLTIQPLMGRAALSASYRLSKYLAPALGKLAGASDAKTTKKKVASLLDANVDLEKVAQLFFDNCTEDEFIAFADLLLDKVFINNVRTDVNSNHFIGYPERIFELLIKSVKYQFTGFFSAFKGKLNGLQ